MQPILLTLPTPVKVLPLQQKAYSPVVVFHANTAAGFERSWMQTLNTLIVTEQVAVLPEASVAVQVTVVVPIGMAEPDGGTQATVTPGQLSVAVGGGKVTTVAVGAGQAGAATAMMFVGQVIVGGCVSLTVTVKVQVGPADDVQVTVVVPTGKKEPEAGEQVMVPHWAAVGAG